MKELDTILAQAPTASAVSEMALTRIRNIQCFDELAAFNNTGKWLLIHPLISGRNEYNSLIDLLQRDPAEFLRQHRCVLDNVKRYKSYLKRKDRRDKRDTDREALARYNERNSLFEQVLSSFTKNSDNAKEITAPNNSGD
ncbi:MAG: hypothetical protein ACI4UC_08685 [Alloprevotella sp.]